MAKKGFLVIISILALLSLVAGIVGCASSAPAPTITPSLTPSPATSPTSAPSPTPAAKPVTTPSPTPSKVIKWRAQAASTGSTWGYSAYWLFYWAEWLKKVTSGRIEVEVLPVDSLVPGAELFNAVSKGMLNAAYAHGGNHTGIVPEANIEIGLPFAWQNERESLEAYLKYGLLDKYRAIYAKHNVFWSPVPLGAKYAIMTTYPFNSYDDFKGKKFRAVGAYADIIKAFGGTTVTIASYADQYMALKLGTMDGVIYNANGLKDYKFQEVVKYINVDPNSNNITPALHINMDSFNALPEDIKLIISESSTAVAMVGAQGFNIITDINIKSAVAQYGIKEVVLTGAERDKAISAGIVTWDAVAAKSPSCAEIVEIVKKQMRDYGRLK